MNSKRLLLATLMMGAVGWASAQTAETYPSRSVRISTPFPAGTGPDTVLRAVADKLAALWKQPVVIDNKLGANGVVAGDAVRKASADGYELLNMDNFQMTALGFMQKNPSFIVLRDFEPVTPLYRSVYYVAVSSASPFRTMGDLIQAAREKPGSITYGSIGVGSLGHIGGALVEGASGVKMVHVPYKAAGQMFTDMASQTVDWTFAGAGSFQPLVAGGKLKFLAVAAPVRQPGFPDLSTISEAGGGLKDFQFSGWVGLLAPKGTPKPVLEKINRDITTVMKDPEIQARLAGLVYEPYVMKAEEFRSVLQQESVKYEKLVKSLNISID